MKKSDRKLWRLVKLLSDKDLERLDWFLDQEENADRKKMMFQILGFIKEGKTPEEVALILFPKVKNPDGRLRKVSFYLTDYIECFWLMEDALRKKSLESEMRNSYQIAVMYRTKGELDLWIHRIKKMLATLEKYPGRDRFFHFWMYRIRMQMVIYSILTKNKDLGKQIKGLNDTHDTWWGLSKLVNNWIADSYKSIFVGQDLESRFSSLVIDSYLVFDKDLKESDLGRESYLEPLPSDPLLKFYCDFQLFLDSREESRAEEFLALLPANKEKLDPDSYQLIYSILQNFYAKKINLHPSNIQYYASKLFELYLQGLESDFLLTNGRLRSGIYVNIISAGLYANRLDKSRELLESEELLKKLPEEEREETHLLCLSTYAFYARDYKGVLELLEDKSFDSKIYDIYARIRILMTRYELGERVSLENEVRSVTAFIRTKKLSKRREAPFINFTRIFSRVLKMNPNRKKLLLRLEREIEGESMLDALYQRKWLYEKVDAIVNG